MSTAVLSCDYSIRFINWNRCGRTGGHSQAREGLEFTVGKQQDKIPPLALKATCWFDGRTQKMFTGANTYDSSWDESVHLLKSHIWKLGSSQCHFPWRVNAGESSHWIWLVWKLTTLREKIRAQIRARATFTCVIYIISKDNAIYPVLYPQTPSIRKVLRGCRYNVLLLFQQIPLK